MNTHLFIIHFPIAAAVIGAAVELIGVAVGNPALRVRGGQLLMIAGFSAFLAFLTGDGARLAAINTGEIDLTRLALHEQWGSVGTWVLVGGAMARGVWRNRFDGAIGWLNVAIIVLSAAVAVAITITGTGVRHG